jgi:uncharacterized protein YndB with AHSA1/START domain
MMVQNLEIKAAIEIQKPAAAVFEAITDPAHMSRYFISRSTGIMEKGKQLVWNFPEFDIDVPVRVGKLIQNQYLSFYWAGDDQKELLVEISLSSRENGSTVVTVTEKGMNNDEAGINWLKGNTEGWANFLACLKAYLEYGINLRKGAFDFRGTAS